MSWYSYYLMQKKRFLGDSVITFADVEKVKNILVQLQNSFDCLT